jgi:hypothetical protein
MTTTSAVRVSPDSRTTPSARRLSEKFGGESLISLTAEEKR